MKHILFAVIAAFGLSTAAIACDGKGETCPLNKEDCQKQHQQCKYGKGETCSLSKEECKKQHQHGKQGKSMDPASKAKWKAKHEKRMSEHFDKADTNQDGMLSKEEFMSAKKPYKRKDHHDQTK